MRSTRLWLEAQDEGDSYFGLLWDELGGAILSDECRDIRFSALTRVLMKNN